MASTYLENIAQTMLDGLCGPLYSDPLPVRGVLEEMSRFQGLWYVDRLQALSQVLALMRCVDNTRVLYNAETKVVMLQRPGFFNVSIQFTGDQPFDPGFLAAPVVQIRRCHGCPLAQANSHRDCRLIGDRTDRRVFCREGIRENQSGAEIWGIYKRRLMAESEIKPKRLFGISIFGHTFELLEIRQRFCACAQGPRGSGRAYYSDAEAARAWLWEEIKARARAWAAGEEQ